MVYGINSSGYRNTFVAKFVACNTKQNKFKIEYELLRAVKKGEGKNCKIMGQIEIEEDSECSEIRGQCSE